MHADDLRRIITWLQDRVTLTEAGSCRIAFAVPSAAEMAAAGLHPEGIAQVRGAPWWDEMVADVVETPDLCDGDDPPQQVLAFARDVIAEYVRKRVRLE